MTKPKLEALKPCPFCGCNCIRVHFLGVVAVYCDGCGARTGSQDTQAEAIAAWNKRWRAK